MRRAGRRRAFRRRCSFARSGASRWRRCARFSRRASRSPASWSMRTTGATRSSAPAWSAWGSRMASRFAARPSCAVVGVPGPQSATAIAQSAPEDAWESVTWGTGTAGPLTARFCALRVRPTKGRGDRWLLCERSATDERKYYLLHLPATTALVDLVALARSRWPIEQQYRELKDDLGLDHFEGPHVSGLGASRRPDGRRVYLPTDRTRTRHRRAPTHAARRPRVGARNHGPALRHPQSAATLDARQLSPECAAPKVTK